MEKLLPYYERELASLRRDCAVFSERYPAIAGALQIAPDAARDTGVEQVIQSFALLTARIAKRLDDDHPKITESLLESLYPHYLRSFPSCSIAHLDNRMATGSQRDTLSTLPRGTILRTAMVRGIQCQFKTVYDTLLTPMSITGTNFRLHIDAPPGARLQSGVASCLSIGFDASGAVSSAVPSRGRLRVYIDADAALAGAVRDALFRHAHSAYLSTDTDQRWTALKCFPVAPVGFEEADALIPYGERSHPAFRLLTEYFAFPEKFNFFDIDLDALATAAPWQRSFTLHLGLAGIDATTMARNLDSLAATHLRLHCTPVVNLFTRHAAPVSITHRTPDYGLVADVVYPRAYEIHTVESVALLTGNDHEAPVTQLRPFYGLGHGQGQGAGYWVTRRDEMLASASPGHELRIALVDHDLAPLDYSARTLVAELTCSNRDLPTHLTIGVPEGDLRGAGVFDDIPIRLLRRPTPSLRFDAGNGAHWRLISHLTLTHRALNELGVEHFRQMLTLYDLPQSVVSRRQISGVSALGYTAVMDWVPGTPTQALMPGMEVRVTVDEQAFVGGGLHLFCEVLDHFFGLYGQINVFTRLVVLAKSTGQELLRCRPRSGIRTLT